MSGRERKTHWWTICDKVTERRALQFICCYPSLTVPSTLLSDVAHHHIDLPTGKGNKKGNSVLSDK